MAEQTVPHFHNDPGVDVIHVGVRELQCVGALPPFDHPHVFLDMGSDDEVLCPYCSTLYRRKDGVPADGAEPAACVYVENDR